MRDQLETSFRPFYTQMGATITIARPDEIVTEDGLAVHKSSWLVTVGGHQLAIIASFGEKPMGAKQHLMTFTVLH